MIKLKTFNSILAVLIQISILSAQNEIPNNVSFANESITAALNELEIFEELLSDRGYHIHRSKSDNLSAFMTDVVNKYLKENGFKAAVSNGGKNPETALFIRIIEPMLDLNVKGGDRTLDGEFILFLYSVERGKINWGEEYPVKIEGKDNVKGRSVIQLNNSAPDFLRVEKRAVFSGKKLEKVLAVTVAGIITYLFYSVRG